MPANYSLNFDFGTCSISPLGRGKKPSRLQQMLGDDPFENSLVEQMSLINKAIFQAPAPSYSKRCVTARCFPKHFDSIFFRLSIAMCDFSRASEAATRSSLPSTLSETITSELLAKKNQLGIARVCVAQLTLTASSDQAVSQEPQIKGERRTLK